MRTLVLLPICAAWLTLAAGPAVADSDDNPKPAAPSPAPVSPVSRDIPPSYAPAAPIDSDDDDPKRDHSGPPAAPSGPAHATPGVKLSYRYLGYKNLDGSNMGFHGAQLDVYPISVRYFRLGMEAEVGSGSGSNVTMPAGMGTVVKPNSAWVFNLGLSVGFQYPGRVTPFVDLRFAAGLLGGDVAGNSGVTYGWVGGIDVGIEVYVSEKVYFSGAVGWARPVYHGFDLAAHVASPNEDLKYLDIVNDSVTVKIGIGL